MEPGEASTVFIMFGTDSSKALGPDRLHDSEGDTVGGGRGCESDLCLDGTCLSVPPQLHRWRLQGVIPGPPSGLCGQEKQALCPGQEGGLPVKSSKGQLLQQKPIF